MKINVNFLDQISNYNLFKHKQQNCHLYPTSTTTTTTTTVKKLTYLQIHFRTILIWQEDYQKSLCEKNIFEDCKKFDYSLNIHQRIRVKTWTHFHDGKKDGKNADDFVCPIKNLLWSISPTFYKRQYVWAKKVQKSFAQNFVT